MSRRQKWSLGEKIELCLGQKEDLQKRAENLLLERRREPGSWTHSLQGRIKSNTACTVAAGVPWEVSWCAHICPMVESVSTVNLSWGHFLPKGSLSLARHGGLGLQVGTAEGKDAEEHTQ